MEMITGTTELTQHEINLGSRGMSSETTTLADADAAFGQNGAALDILVVDDDEEMRLAVSYMLERMGHHVRAVANAREAFIAIEAKKPQIVLTDALMPSLDGRQLCRLVKAIHPDLKVIIMTSLYTAPRYKYEAFKSFRADEYIAKPLNAAKLRTIVSKLAPRAPAAGARVG